ncbi:MAG: hypothetical protein OXL37_03515 [Chloroflexota bacterium]|nr:hypothetical protein [Chloroflexota bacterium]MDE2961392.1 hypothetical protein [Chloroflexota bacterium]
MPTAPPQAAAASPTDAPMPVPTATVAPTPTPTTAPTATLVPPTNTPAPTFTPRPQPTATLAATPRPTDTPRPAATPTPIPTFAPRPTNTPTIPSAIKELENGEWLVENERALASHIATLAWVADGLEADEVEPAQRLVDLALWFPEVFAIAVKQEWLEDDVTGDEAIALASIRWLAYYGDGFPAAISRMSWFGDGITVHEATVIQNLYWLVWDEDDMLVQENIKSATGLLAMPFMDRIDGADALAVRSLRSLEYDDEQTYLKVLSHPKIEDGITDKEAKMVALLGGTYSYRQQSGDVLLRGTGAHWEERSIDLPMSGDVSLAVVRIRDQSTASMDYLEHSVRTIADFMGVGLPTDYIALLYDDAVFPGSGGTNFGTHMAIQLLFDVEGGHWWEYTPFVIGHEVAHYYWHGNSNWIDEGAAEVLGSISEYARNETPIDVTNNPCAAAETIGELEAMDPDALGTRGFNCNYSLGERLFLDLYNSLGEETFRQGFRTLYLKSQAEDYSDDCEGTELGICHLVAAFKADVTEAQAAMVDEIVARWYGPLP